jgi:hypothetical protein
VVTDASSNLVSLEYTSLNTPSTLVARDVFGNFVASTITAGNLFLNSLSSMAGVPTPGVLVLDTQTVKTQTYATLAANLNVPSINPINVAPSINAQGLWLEWNSSEVKPGSPPTTNGESFIINQKGLGGGGIIFAKSDTPIIPNNIERLGRFDDNGVFYNYTTGAYGIGDAGASNHSLDYTNPYYAFLQNGMLCGNYPGYIAAWQPAEAGFGTPQSSNSGSGGSIRTRDGGYAIQFAVRNSIGAVSNSQMDGETLNPNQWALSIYVTEIATGRTGRFVSFVENEADCQLEIGHGTAGSPAQSPGFGTPGSQNIRPGNHGGRQINF